jgi:predicted  nucleic acid-binding Zn-ribbon protein
MDNVLSSNGIIVLLLGMVGFLLVRLLKVIDKNTDAVGELKAVVEKLSMLIDAQKERIERVERDVAKSVGAVDAEMQLLRNRVHDLTNRVQVVISRFEFNERRKNSEDS